MKREGGFALAEIAVALLFITMAIMLVSTLGTQVMNLSKSSKQTAAVLEMRTKTNSISRNSAPWLSEMRGSPVTGSLYAACIPDSSAVTAPLVYNCPTTDDSLLQSDAELARLAGTQMHIASSPVVDAMGEQIAGSADAPLYLDSEGRPCTNSNAATSCPMKSTGYLLRTNPATDSDPGYVKFVVKVERNMASISATGNTTPMKAQYMSLDIGNDWKTSVSCPAGSIKIGYLTTGAANCINSTLTQSCGSSQYLVGVDSSGNLICKDVPTCTAGSAVLDPKTNTFQCSNTSPCGSGQIFSGYFAGQANKALLRPG